MFVELKAKSNFSFLRGASDSREYIAQAVALGLPAIAITDVNGVYALPRAYEALKEIKDKLLCSFLSWLWHVLVADLRLLCM